MTNIRFYNPRTQRQIGLNLAQLCQWSVETLVYANSNKPAPGFCVRLSFTDGKTISINHDEGGQALLELLETMFYPLNDPPLAAETSVSVKLVG